MSINKVLVVGSGLMGAGIAQVCAQQGLDAVLTDISQELSDKGKSRIESGLAGRVAKGKVTEDEKNAVLSRIQTAGDLSPAKEVGLVIECAVENLDIKKKIFAELDKIARRACGASMRTIAFTSSTIEGKSG